jgi:hypothetical protein
MSGLPSHCGHLVGLELLETEPSLGSAATDRRTSPEPSRFARIFTLAASSFATSARDQLPLGAERVGVRWGSPVPNSRATHLILPAQPRRNPPLPPQAGGERLPAGFLPVTRCPNAVHLEPGSEGLSRFFGSDIVAIFSSRSRSIISVRVAEVGRRYGWSGGRLRGPPALPVPSLRASISLPAKTAGPLRVWLVNLLLGNGLWRYARRFLDAAAMFLPVLREASAQIDRVALQHLE